ncbi:hypothetical protein LCGC14_1964640, partial [marine sediment metagenome]
MLNTTCLETINLNQILNEVIQNFQELTDVSIKQQINAEVQLKMDKYLASVLFNNLLSNAVKHNKEDQPIA